MMVRVQVRLACRIRGSKVSKRVGASKGAGKDVVCKEDGHKSITFTVNGKNKLK